MKLGTSRMDISWHLCGWVYWKGTHRHRGNLVSDKGTKAVSIDKIVLQTTALDQLPTTGRSADIDNSLGVPHGVSSDRIAGPDFLLISKQ